MHLSVKRTALLEALRTLRGADILLSADKGLSVRASGNGYIVVAEVTPATILRGGKLVVKRRDLENALKHDGDDVDIIGDGMSLVVGSGDNVVRISARSGEDCPEPPPGEEGAVLKLSQEQVDALKRKVVPFVAGEGGQPRLRCVQIKRDQQELVAVASDGFRLAKLVLGEGGEPIEVMVHAEILRMLPPSSASVFSSGLVEAEGVRGYSLVRDAYPQWQSVVSMTASYRGAVRLPAETVRRLLRLPLEKDGVIALFHKGGSVAFVAWVPSPYYGGKTIQGAFPAEVRGAEGFKVAFGVHYLRSILRVMDGDVEYRLEGSPNSPVRFEEPGFVALLMPRFIDWSNVPQI